MYVFLSDRIHQVDPNMLNTQRKEKKYWILFIFSLFCEYINLEYVRVPVRQNSGLTLVAAPQEYVNTYSTRRARYSAPARSRGATSRRRGLGLG